MQQPPPMIPVIPSFPPTNITTEQIQKYLDENKKLILAILDNQNLGKLAECAQYQAQLQKNLMYLAAIADAQPQAPAMPPQHMQIGTHPAMTQGGFYIQHPQAPSMGQQPGIFPPKMPLQFNNLHHHMQEHQQQQQQQQLLQHQQALQGQMGVRPGGPNNGMHPMHGEANLGVGGSGGPPTTTSNQNDRNKQQDGSDVGPSNANGSSAGGHVGGEGSEEGK